MSIIDQIKGNKKFRNRLIIVLIAIFLIYSGGEKKEATPQSQCDAHNINSWLNPLESHATGCENDGCVIQYNVNPSDWVLGTGTFTNLIKWVVNHALGINAQFATCNSLAETGKWVRAVDENSANLMCTSGKAGLAKSSLFGDDLYICSYVPTEEQCKPSEKALAKLLWPKVIDNCKMAYTVIIVGGGFFALVFLLAVL